MPENLPDWITAATAILAVFWGVMTYRREQKWKRAEWVLSEVRTFLKEPLVRNALLMLDWESRPLRLLVDGYPEDKTFDYEEGMLLHALSSKTQPQKRPYSHEEVCIRECFDELLNGLDRFEKFAKEGLVETKDLAPFIQYWVDVIGDANNEQKPEHIRDRIWAYIRDYRFNGVTDLLKRFGHSIS
jgi:hypothetical protein